GDHVLRCDLRGAMFLNRADRARCVLPPEIRRPEQNRHDEDRDDRAEAEENLVPIRVAHWNLLLPVNRYTCRQTKKLVNRCRLLSLLPLFLQCEAGFLRRRRHPDAVRGSLCRQTRPRLSTASCDPIPALP